jgi:hypothetical protein
MSDAPGQDDPCRHIVTDSLPVSCVVAFLRPSFLVDVCGLSTCSTPNQTAIPIVRLRVSSPHSSAAFVVRLSFRGDNSWTSIDDSRKLGPVNRANERMRARCNRRPAPASWSFLTHGVLSCVLCADQIPMGLLSGRVTHIVWPPSRIGRVETTLEPAGGEQRIRKRANSYGQ